MSFYVSYKFKSLLLFLEVNKKIEKHSTLYFLLVFVHKVCWFYFLLSFKMQFAVFEALQNNLGMIASNFKRKNKI